MKKLMLNSLVLLALLLMTFQTMCSMREEQIQAYSMAMSVDGGDDGGDGGDDSDGGAGDGEAGDGGVGDSDGGDSDDGDGDSDCVAPAKVPQDLQILWILPCTNDNVIRESERVTDGDIAECNEDLADECKELNIKKIKDFDLQQLEAALRADDIGDNVLVIWDMHGWMNTDGIYECGTAECNWDGGVLINTTLQILHENPDRTVNAWVESCNAAGCLPLVIGEENVGCVCQEGQYAPALQGAIRDLIEIVCDAAKGNCDSSLNDGVMDADELEEFWEDQGQVWTDKFYCPADPGLPRPDECNLPDFAGWCQDVKKGVAVDETIFRVTASIAFTGSFDWAEEGGQIGSDSFTGAIVEFVHEHGTLAEAQAEIDSINNDYAGFLQALSASDRAMLCRAVDPAHFSPLATVLPTEGNRCGPTLGLTCRPKNNRIITNFHFGELVDLDLQGPEEFRKLSCTYTYSGVGADCDSIQCLTGACHLVPELGDFEINIPSCREESDGGP